MSYPQNWLDKLSAGRTLVGLNPLLVGQDGESYISASSATYTKSSKQLELLTLLRCSSSDSTYTNMISVFGITGDYVNNSNNGDYGNSAFFIDSYTSKNPTLEQSEPIEIIEVDNQTIVSNSHSIYKFNNLIDGKIQVGNGSNPLESQLVWNTVLDENNALQTTPTHNTIQLDNSNSPAYKHLICKGVDNDGMVHDVAISQELEFNTGTNSYDGDDSKFTQLTNGTLIDLNGNTVVTKFSTKPTGKFKR